LRCGGIYNNSFITNLSPDFGSEKILKIG